MNFLHFTPTDVGQYRIAILVNKIRKDDIIKEYLKPFGINQDDVIVLDLHQTPGKKKTTAAEMKRYINEELQGVLDDLKIEYVLCADAEYFKALTKAPKADANIGYIMDSTYGAQKVAYIPNFVNVFYDPEKVRAKIAQTVIAVQSSLRIISTPSRAFGNGFSSCSRCLSCPVTLRHSASSTIQQA